MASPGSSGKPFAITVRSASEAPSTARREPINLDWRTSALVGIRTQVGHRAMSEMCQIRTHFITSGTHRHHLCGIGRGNDVVPRGARQELLTARSFAATYRSERYRLWTVGLECVQRQISGPRASNVGPTLPAYRTRLLRVLRTGFGSLLDKRPTLRRDTGFQPGIWRCFVQRTHASCQPVFQSDPAQIPADT